MAVHSSALAWRIPWTEEPGGLRSIGLQRVRLHGRDLAHIHTGLRGFPGGSGAKKPPAKLDPIPGLGRSPEEGNGSAFQYSCLGNSMDGGAWHATVHRVTKSQT